MFLRPCAARTAPLQLGIRHCSTDRQHGVSINVPTARDDLDRQAVHESREPERKVFEVSDNKLTGALAVAEDPCEESHPLGLEFGENLRDETITRRALPSL